MKAIVYHKYGTSEVLSEQEMPKPEPKGHEVLVKVKAASINPYDWHIMTGKPYFVRFTTGVFKPSHTILGNDLSGVVEQVGSSVRSFKVGDEVFGGHQYGGFAEYATVPENKLAIKPDVLSWTEAASLPIAGVTALQGFQLEETLSGQRALINGASGGVGSFAIQIAKSLDMHVTGVCSGRNIDLVRGLGADRVINYQQDELKDEVRRYDLVIDNVGNLTYTDIMRLKKTSGKGVVVGYQNMPSMMKLMIKTKVFNDDISILQARERRIDLEYLRDLVVYGKLRPYVEKVYPLSETSAAMTYLLSGHVRGKLVIQIDD